MKNPRFRTKIRAQCWRLLILTTVSVPLSVLPASADSLKVHVALFGYMTTAFVDTAETSYCIALKTCREANPVLRPLVERHGVVPAMAVKGAMHTGIAWFLLTQHKDHPKAAFWSTLALIGAQTAVDIHNIRAIQKR